MLDPYLEPAPEPAYIFSATDDILIELGEAVDPQGFEVAVDVKLGAAKEFLETDGKVISLRKDLE